MTLESNLHKIISYLYPDVALDRCRYIEYMCDMMAEEPIVPHSKPIVIHSIVMTPVPLFNKQRNGCRPFCEVYVGDERVLTTSQEYDKMKYVEECLSAFL